MTPLNHPPRLYVYAPSGAVRDTDGFMRGVQRLRTRGYAVEVDTAALASHERFAGDDATRAAAIGRAAASGAHIAMIARGGYGLTRLLPALPWADIACSIAAGTRWVGFSDFTALQMGLLAWAEREQSSLPLPVTWAGPALVADFGGLNNPDPFMLEYFERISQYSDPKNLRWQLKWKSSNHLENHIFIQNMPKPRVQKSPFLAEVEPASISGILWGGNLTVLSSLVGTPWLPNITEGILFLEDVGEHPYRVERMLTQLLNAGILSAQKAILFGQFSEYRLSEYDRGFDMPNVLQWLRAQLPPYCFIIDGLPFGHVPTKALLPVGQMVQLQMGCQEGGD